MNDPATSLIYRRLEHAAGIEVSDWIGVDGPSLATHFHDEAQLSVVVSGCRWLEVASKAYRVDAGHFLLLPARVPHRSFARGGLVTRSHDVFLAPSEALELGPRGVLSGRFAADGCVDIERVTYRILRDIRREKVAHAPLVPDLSFSDEIVRVVREGEAGIAAIATATGLSREGFIRKFDREIGMTPYAYRLAHRGSVARASLRAAIAPADAAHEAGFADQSHLGRVFKKLYGTTPAAFRDVWRR